MSASPLTVAVGIFSTPVWTIRAEHVDALRARFPDVTFLHASSHDELAGALEQADVAFSSMVREAAFPRARKLRWIHSSAAGVGATLFPALVSSDIVLTNSRGVQAGSIAEHVLALMLAWRRGLHTAMRRQLDRRWAADELSNIASGPLSGTRVLVVGAGSIGRGVQQLCSALGMPVTAMRRTSRDGMPGVHQLPAALPDHDVVVITAPHTPETDRLFDAPMLARMRQGSLLVNVGRGRIVDEAALIQGLQQGRPGAAALDVFEKEPLAPDSPLWAMDNVIITPHVAGFNAQYWEGLVDLFARNLERWRAGQPLENVVDKNRGY